MTLIPVVARDSPRYVYDDMGSGNHTSMMRLIRLSSPRWRRVNRMPTVPSLPEERTTASAIVIGSESLEYWNSSSRQEPRMTSAVVRIRHPRIERFSITPSCPSRGEPGVRCGRNQTGNDTSTRSKLLRGLSVRRPRNFRKRSAQS